MAPITSVDSNFKITFDNGKRIRSFIDGLRCKFFSRLLPAHFWLILVERICRRLDCAYAIVVVVEEDVSSCSEILLLTR